jgi:hypothetical protein
MLSGNPGLPREKAERLLEFYRSFIKTRKSYIILDSGKPDGALLEEAYAAIIAVLARRTQRALQSRF